MHWRTQPMTPRGPVPSATACPPHAIRHSEAGPARSSISTVLPMPGLPGTTRVLARAGPHTWAPARDSQGTGPQFYGRDAPTLSATLTLPAGRSNRRAPGPERGRRAGPPGEGSAVATVTVGQENNSDIEIYYEDHGAGP